MVAENTSNTNDPLVANSNKGNKPRVGVILRQSLGGAKSHHSNEELEELKQRYQTMCENLKQVQKALKERHQALLNTAAARSAVAQAISDLSRNSPMEPVAGFDESGNQKASNTYFTIMIDNMDRRTKKRATDFESFAINYVAEWEKTVTTRVNADIKTTESLRLNADHYQNKVTSLQTQVKNLESKNKPVPDATKEKLERNLEKSQQATMAYNDAASDLYVVMEEVVDRSWRDLHPLLLQILQWDVAISQEETEKMVQPLQSLVQDDLNQLQRNYQLNENGQHRLQDMVDGSPGLLSTRPGGVDSLTLSFGGGGGRNNSNDENNVP